MILEIDKISELPDGKTHVFNLYLQSEGFSSILSGWRVMNGKIYSPAVKNKTGYTPVLFTDASTAMCIYQLVKERAPYIVLEEPRKAPARLVSTDDTLKTFLPTLAAQMA